MVARTESVDVHVLFLKHFMTSSSGANHAGDCFGAATPPPPKRRVAPVRGKDIPPMRTPVLAPLFVLALGMAPLLAVAAVDPANVNGNPVVPPPSTTNPAIPPNMSPEVAAQMQQLMSSLPPGPTGDAATACEVILCLAGSAGAGGRVSECVPPIRRYLTIKPWRRLNFLRLCPKTSGQGDARMDRLVEIMARAPGADNEGRICSASAINTVNRRPLGDGEFYIANDMPADCGEYYSHEYTDLKDSVPRYIGEPLDGGFWAEQDEAAAAQARYDAEREERRRNGVIGGGREQQQSAYSTL